MSTGTALGLVTTLLLSAVALASAQDGLAVFTGSNTDNAIVVTPRIAILISPGALRTRTFACGYTRRNGVLVPRSPCLYSPLLHGDHVRMGSTRFEQRHDTLRLRFRTRRLAWSAVAEIATSLGPGECTPTLRIGPTHVVQCDGVDLRLRGRAVVVEPEHTRDLMETRCAAYPETTDFENLSFDHGVACFRDFAISRDSTREDIDRAFGGECVAHGDDLQCGRNVFEIGEGVRAAEE